MDRREAARVLGVAPEASLEEVRHAYRAAALVHHPDLALNGAAPADEMARVNEAYAVLRDWHGRPAPAPVIIAPGFRAYGRDDAGSTQHVSIARLRALFASNPLDRRWPLWLALFLVFSGYVAYSAVQFNPVGFGLGLNLAIAFGLMAWSNESRSAIGHRLRRAARAVSRR
jgi:hypothetical protein